jgi:hypothetical protein
MPFHFGRRPTPPIPLTSGCSAAMPSTDSAATTSIRKMQDEALNEVIRRYPGPQVRGWVDHAGSHLLARSRGLRRRYWCGSASPRGRFCRCVHGQGSGGVGHHSSMLGRGHPHAAPPLKRPWHRNACLRLSSQRLSQPRSLVGSHRAIDSGRSRRGRRPGLVLPAGLSRRSRGTRHGRPERLPRPPDSRIRTG